MYISEEEYLDLKNQIKALSEKVEFVGKPTTFAGVVTVKPYSSIKNKEEDIPVFEPTAGYGSDDAWNAFVKLGKTIHRSISRFQMEKCRTGGLYIRSIGHIRTPRTIADMTKEQIELSARMIDEMVEVYNRYFAMANQYVLFAQDNSGSYEEVSIRYPE